MMLFKYIAGGLGFVALLLGLALHMERRSGAKKTEQIIKLSAELHRITSARDDQTKRSEKTVTKVIQGKSNPQADRIERAPIPHNCQTAPEIMGADL